MTNAFNIKSINASMWRYRQRFVVALVWIMIASIGWYTLHQYNYEPASMFDALQKLLNTPLGILVFILLYWVRTFTGFSTAVFSLIAAAALGLLPAIGVAVIGLSGSTVIGVWLGKHVFKVKLKPGHRWYHRQQQLIENSFTGGIISRLSQLPFDTVSYIGGAVGVKTMPFTIGSTIGAIPGTLLFATIGSQVRNYQDLNEIDLGKLAPVGLVVILALLAVWIVNNYIASSSGDR